MAQKFYITESRFIQQVGESEPRHVEASPSSPVVVYLPDNFEKSKFDHTLHYAEQPEPPKSVSPDKRAEAVKRNLAAPVVDVPVAQVAEAVEAKNSKKKKRAADE